MSLTVTSRSVAEVDALALVASGIVDGTQRSMLTRARLPVGLAVSLPTATSGRLQLDVTGELLGNEVGRGTTAVEVVAGQHTAVSVELVASGLGGGDMIEPTADFAGLDLAGACSATDDGCEDASTLKRCRSDGMGFDLVSCAGGCATTPAPHCMTLVPTVPVAKSDLTTAGLDDVTITGEALLNADTGEISGSFTRAANVNQLAVEVKSGIAYHQTTSSPIAGVFTSHSLTIAPGATVKVVSGSYYVALVAQTTMAVNGVIDVRPIKSDGTLCPTDVRIGGPGSGSGGAAGSFGPTNIPGMPGVGLGGGEGGQAAQLGNWGGGGGAGYAADGSNGNQGCRNGAANTGGGMAGHAYVGPTLLYGGSGGGGGGHAMGGGGGGAVQLVAGEVLSIGNGSGPQGVNAGGCGGVGNAAGSGGGGSGGTIVVEAPVVQLRALGTLAANGGGGGAYSSAPADGQPGKLSADPAYGGGSTQFSTLGANGGAGTSLGGGMPVGICTGDGFGGAGAAGRIYVKAAGMPNINPLAVLSPTVTSGATKLSAATLE